MTVWINVKDIADGAKFHAGAAIKIMSTPRGLEEGNFIPEGGPVYLISDNASDKSYFNCVCLSPWRRMKRDLSPLAKGQLRTWKRDQAGV